ncbi:hypothetical protein NMG60_11018064 [Bertholletia excelsa]
MDHHAGENFVPEIEPVMERITEEYHDHDYTSDSDDDKSSHPPAVKTKIYRLFGRERPLYMVLGGGKTADIILWRDRKISTTVLGVATAIWVCLELMEYHLLTLVCHILILSLAVLFLWANASAFINQSPPQIPEVHISNEIILGIAYALRIQVNRALAILRDVASGRDLKKFLAAIAGLWFLSIVGSSCSLLTLLYACFVLLHSVPKLYEKYEDEVDPLAEKALAEFKKHYAVFDARVLNKIPAGPVKEKKLD